MANEVKTNGDENGITLGEGVTVYAPGVHALIVHHASYEESESHRKTQEDPEGLGSALREADLQDRHTIEIKLDPEPAKTMDQISPLRETEFRIMVDHPNDGSTAYGVYQDETGVCSFHFGKRSSRGRHTGLEGLTLVFSIPMSLVSVPDVTGGRPGLFGRLGRKVVKLIYGKVVLEAAYGNLLLAAADWWESRHYGSPKFHGGGVADVLSATRQTYTSWDGLGVKTDNLLLLHGTFSSTRGAFGELLKHPIVGTALNAKYGNRILGFDHPTVSKPVAGNATDFLDTLPPRPEPYNFDVLVHSRGGLLARAIHDMPLIHLQRCADKRTWVRPPRVTINFRKVIFVGTPNLGTDLADPDNLPTLLGCFATMLNVMPSSGCVLIGGILKCVAAVARGGLNYLPGLADQALFADGRTGDFLTTLNGLTLPAQRIASYYAIQANHVPDSPLLQTASKAVRKVCFGNRANDLVVPTHSMASVGTSGRVAGGVLEYDGRPIHHTNYFAQKDTWKNILNWL